MSNGLSRVITALEIRQVWSVPITVIGELYQPRLWAGLKSLVMVVRVRHLWNKT